MPIALGADPIGAFVLGRRRSGLQYGREDVALLRTLADQSAISIHNAHSYAELRAFNRTLEDRVRARTAELSRTADGRFGCASRLGSERSASLIPLHPVVGANASGRRFGPKMPVRGRHVGSPSTRTSGMRRARRASASCISARARFAPRQ